MIKLYRCKKSIACVELGVTAIVNLTKAAFCLLLFCQYLILHYYFLLKMPQVSAQIALCVRLRFSL